MQKTADGSSFVPKVCNLIIHEKSEKHQAKQDFSISRKNSSYIIFVTKE